MTPTAVLTATTNPMIDISLVELSGLNPRTHFDGPEDLELQASIEAKGVIEPLVLRPHPKKSKAFQVIAGERRYRAAQAAGVTELPYVVRNVDDAELLDLALAENIQRKTMHPLDTARGFQARLNMDTGATPQSIADTIGLSKRYVVDMLRLNSLGKRAALGLEQGDITVSHAIVLARLPEAVQNDALDDNCERVFDFTTEQSKHVIRSVDALKEWVANHHRLDLRAPDVQEEFPELVADVAKVTAAGATITMLSDDWSLPYSTKATPADPLFKSKWDECKKSDKGAQRGVISYGRRRGKLVWFRLKPEPKPMARTHTSAPTEAEKKAGAARRKREETARKNAAAARNRRSIVTCRAVVSFLAHTPALTGKALLVLLAEDASENTLSLDEAKTIAADVKVPAEALCGQNTKHLDKLTEKQLISVVLAGVVASRATYTFGHKALKSLGIDIAAIDKAVAKEQTAKAKTAGKKATPVKAATTAKKR